MDYNEFFKNKMKEWGIDGISDLSDSDKKKFFKEVKEEWSNKQGGFALTVAAPMSTTLLRDLVRDDTFRMSVQDLVSWLYNATSSDIETKKKIRNKINELIKFIRTTLSTLN